MIGCSLIPDWVPDARKFVRCVMEMQQCVDDALHDVPPSQIIGATVASMAMLALFERCVRGRWGEDTRDQVGRLALTIGAVRRPYYKEINDRFTEFQKVVQERWKVFGEPIIAIPEEGWTLEALYALLVRYATITACAVKEKHLSGTIYSDTLYGEAPAFEDLAAKFQKISVTYCDQRTHLFAFAYEVANLWNSLHGEEFAIGGFLEYQVVRMVADLFGGAPHEVSGVVTSGGTESLMLAMRIYRDWGRDVYGHAPGDAVVIASETVHAGVLKTISSFINVRLVGTDRDKRINLGELYQLMQYYGNKVVAIVGSAPNYGTGVIDPLQEMGKIAQEHGCGMHVDACLGGFIIDSNALCFPGITSLSVDTHKNGQAPKGSSVLIVKALGGMSLAYYAIHALPDWSGGVYGTPTDAGSRSCVPSLMALLTMLEIGKKGYREVRSAIRGKTEQLATAIQNTFRGTLKIIAPPEANVVAFAVDPDRGLEPGATYAFAQEMEKRGFVLSTIRDDAVHMCVTKRFTKDEMAISRFVEAARASLEATQTLNQQLRDAGSSWPGTPAVYGTLKTAMHPTLEELSVRKYIENVILGKRGAHDAVRAYLLAQLDPYTTALPMAGT